jgi:Na+/melibiose symporter-like transporter
MVEIDSRFAFALTTITLFRLTYTLLDTPQNALLALTTADDGARARLASVRYIFGGFANILVAGAFAPLLRGRTGSVHAVVFAVFSAILALLAVASAGMLWRWLRTHPSPRLATAPVGAARGASRDGPRPRRWPIFLIMFVISATTSVFSRLEPYFVAYGLRSSLDGGALMVCVAAGTLVSQPFWSWWAQRQSLVSTLRAAAISLAAGALAFGVGARHGMAPAALSGALYGWGCGGVLMSLWALAAAATRSQDPSRGATATFGALTFSAKVALALSAFGVGEFLTLGDYRTGANGLLLNAMTCAPLVGAVLCLALSSFIFPRHPRRG